MGLVMKDWFVKNMGDPLLAQELLDQLKVRLSSSYLATGSRNNMAAFIRHESEGRLHCEVKIYMSPRFFTAAKEINAESCKRPQSDGLSIFVGSPESWLVLFPAHRKSELMRD